MSSPPILVSPSKPYSVPGRFRFLNQHRPGHRQRQSVAASLLLQSSSKRGRGKVPKDGETNPGIGNRSPKTPPLLPSSYHRNLDRISSEASATQTRDLWKINEVGHRAERVRHQIQTENNNKRADWQTSSWNSP